MTASGVVGFLWSVVMWPPALFFATFVLLYHLNRTFKFYVKLVVYYFIMMTVSFLAIPPAMLKPFEIENTNIVAKLMQESCKIYGIRWDIEDDKYVRDGVPGVVVCNHQSAIDVYGMMVMWPILKRCVSMVKKELRYALSFGVLATICGTVFIDRHNPNKAKDTINKTVTYLKNKNTKVWIFPEGTRNLDGTMLPFKKGAFHLAVQGQMPIYPMVFSSYSHFYNPKEALFGSGTIKVKCLPPISTEGLTGDDVNRLTEDVRQRMLDAFYRISPHLDRTKTTTTTMTSEAEVPNGHRQKRQPKTE